MTRGVRLAVLAGVALVAGMVYWGTRTAQPTADSLTFAYAAKSRTSLFHPHHLLSNVSAVAVQTAFGLVGVRLDELEAGQLHSCLWAVVGIFGVFAVAYRGGLGAWPAGVAAATTAVSLGYWSFATQMESIVPATACASWCLASAVGGGAPGRARARELATGAWFVLACLFHQTSLLLLAPVAVLWFDQRGRERARSFARLVLVGGAVLLAVYLLAFAAEGAAFGGSLRAYFLAYLLHPNPEWGTWRHFGPTGLRQFLTSQGGAILAAGPLAPHRHLLLGLGVVLGVAAALFAGCTRSPGWRKPLVGACLAWIGALWIFFVWWLPQCGKFFIQPVVPMSLLLAGACATSRPTETTARRWPGPGALLAAGIPLLLGGWNLVLGVLPAHRQASAMRLQADAMIELAGADCTVIADYDVYVHLRLLLPEPRVRIDPRFWLFLDRPRPAIAELPPAGCRVLALTALAPGAEVAGRSGVTNPEAWWSFVVAFLDLSKDPLAGGCTMANPRTVRGRDARDYLVVGATRSPMQGGAEVLRRLGETSGSEAFAAELEAWGRAHATTLAGAGCGGPPGSGVR